MSLVSQPNIRDQIDLIKRTVAKGCTDLELELFVKQCERTGLDPFARQIYAIKRYDAQAKTDVMQTQVSIDGLRSLAADTGELGGQDGPYWCGPDGLWRDVWLQSEPPRAARVIVARRTYSQDACFTGVALWDSYAQRKRDGRLTRMWEQMGPEMLAKCAEAQALRKAFSQRLSGLYTSDEMDQASNEQPEYSPSRGKSPERPPEGPVSDPRPVRPVSPILEPPRRSEPDTEAPEGPELHATITSDPLGPMRSRVSLSLGRLSMENRSAVLAKGDALKLQLPEEQSFTHEHANSWLALIKDVDHD